MPEPDAPDNPAVPPGWGRDATDNPALPPGWGGDSSSSSSYSWQQPSTPPPWPPGGSGGRRMRPLVVVLAIAGLVLIAGGIGAAATLVTRGHSGGGGASSTAPPSGTPNSATAARARQLFQHALTAMRSSKGFHYVAVTNGPETQRIEGDAGQDQGTQLITFNSTYGAEQFSLVLSNGTVYFQGNVPALQDQLGVAAGSAPALDGKWVAVVRGDGPYNVLQPGITVADQVGETALVPASTQSVSAPDGTGATRIVGTVPPQNGAPGGTGYVDVATGSGLPIQYVTSISAQSVSLTSTATFSKWGNAPSVTVPSGAVAWSTLGASVPPGGYGSGGSNGAGPSQTPGVNV